MVKSKYKKTKDELSSSSDNSDNSDNDTPSTNNKQQLDNTTNTLVEDKPKKRNKPGRPPCIRRSEKPRLGIVTDTTNKHNSIEFYCATPIVFKKLFAHYQKINVDDLYIKFDSNSIQFITKSFNDIILTKTEIDATKVHKYYCETPVNIKIGRESMGKAIKRIDPKIHESVTFSIDPIINTNKLIIKLHNSQINKDTIVKINMIQEEYEDTNNWDSSRYELSFKLPHDIFKKDIVDIANISDSLMIEKSRGVKLLYKYNEGSLTASEKFNDESKIDLKTKNDSQVIGCTVLTSPLKAFATTPLNTEVHIFIDNHLKFMCQVVLDEAICTTVLFN